MKKMNKKMGMALFLGMIGLGILFEDASRAYAAEGEILYYFDSENGKQEKAGTLDTITVTAENLLKNDAEIIETDGRRTVLIEPDKEAEFEVEIPEAGYYHIGVSYRLSEQSMSDTVFALAVNNDYQFYENQNLILEGKWQDQVTEYETDENGNDCYPDPQQTPEWQVKYLNSEIYNLSDPYVYYFQKGKNTLTFTGKELGFFMDEIYIRGQQDVPDFETYKADIQNTGENSEIIVQEGEKYTWKTHSYIRGSRTNDHNAFPYEADKKKINKLDGATWAVPNEGVTYEFEVEKTGLYYITFKYSQSEKEDIPAFKQILLDGQYPVEEMKSYPFRYTGSGKWKNETLNINGESIPFYLEEGSHTLKVVSTAQSVYETYENLRAVNDRINDISLEIKVITGGKSDPNRDWEMESYIPGLEDELRECADLVGREYEVLAELAGENDVSVINNLKIAAERLISFAEDTNFLVNNLDELVQGSNSASEYISLVITDLLEQPMDLDQILISGKDAEIPAAMKGFLYSAGENIKKFILSFTQDDGSEEVKEGELNIWVNHSTAHLDVLKEMTESFEKETGIQVNLSLMPDEQKLLLAVSAGQAPDAVIGLSNYRPFDFALRGAMYDLRQFDDFAEILDSFHPESLIPFIIEDSCYAIPEMANFHVLFYRTDVMEALNLKIPDTWDDVIEILPTLSRYGMDFNTTIANVGSTKDFTATMPFIQQFGGKVYSEDGTRVELGDANTVEAFTLMTDLYTKYSLPENVANFFNNFKKGTTPIGIADINTYILLRNAAPEIAGQWEIAPSIGVENENGEVVRYQQSVMTANGIMKDSEYPEEAWEFIKWYMSDAVQTEYANRLSLRYGSEYIWNTANLNALENSIAFPSDDKEVIMEQLSWTKEIPRNPAYFSVEREISNAWNKVVFDGMAPRTALDQAITTCNRSITKKLKEFGYLDEQGNLIKPFTMATGETVEQWKEGNVNHEEE